MSDYDALEARVQALGRQRCMTGWEWEQTGMGDYEKYVHETFYDFEKRVEALERLTARLSMEGVPEREVVVLGEELFSQQRRLQALEKWANYPSGSPQPVEAVRFPTHGVERVPEGWAGDTEVWRTGTIALFHSELEGLDLPGFRTLLREKLQSLGDSLVAAWKKDHPGGG